MIAQAEHLPGHLGGLSNFLEEALKDFPPSELKPGDSIISNDVYRGGNHLPDISLLTPIFHQDQLAGYAVNRAHHADIGGMSPGSLAGDSTDIFQEGLRIPPVKLYSEGNLVTDIMKLILNNVRTPEERIGDLSAMVGANRVMERRYKELLERYGPQTVERYIDAILDYTEILIRREIEKIPDGIYEEEEVMDAPPFSEEPLKIKVRIEVKGNGIHFDFAGSSNQQRAGVNCQLTGIISNVYLVMKYLAGADIPTNAGFYRPITVSAPEGIHLQSSVPRRCIKRPGGDERPCNRRDDPSLLQGHAQKGHRQLQWFQ